MLLNNNLFIERVGTFCFLPYIIGFTSSGRRRGYVGVFKDHPYFEKEEDLSLTAHRGVIAEGFNQELQDLFYYFKDKPIWWFSFDCDQIFDEVDIDLVLEYFPNRNTKKYIDTLTHLKEITSPMGKAILRSKKYVRVECYYLARQLNNIKELSDFHNA